MTDSPGRSHPPAPAPRRGILCPCGGRTEVYSVHRPCAGVVIRYRVCLACSGRVTTREAVISTRPARSSKRKDCYR